MIPAADTGIAYDNLDEKNNTAKDKPLKIGISSCLLGEKVRYDGGHKHDRFLSQTLGKFVSYIPVCPETECGLGVPRESMSLHGDIDAPRLITHKSKTDHTERMRSWCSEKLKTLEKEELCGFIFKKDSPSSGLYRVKVFNDKKQPVKKGTGIFAGAFINHFPHLPVEEEGRLHDPVIRENFIERIFVMKRWREMVEKEGKRKDIIEFHTRHKLIFMAHSQKHYRELGRLTASVKHMDVTMFKKSYLALATEALELKTTPSKNVNVLMHIMGYFKKDLSADEKKELLSLIDDYKNEYIPLIVPITLLNHYTRKYNNDYLKKQYYLLPHPLELKLRNHV